MIAYHLIYIFFGLGVLAGGVNVVAQKNPVNSAISLLFTFMCVAALYILHGSPFLAMIQIIVYAGAILILVVFTIMLLALREPGQGLGKFWTMPQKLAALIVGVALAVELVIVAVQGLGSLAAPAGASLAEIASPATLGKALFSKYLLPFEVASVLLLVAIVGAVVLTRRPHGTAAAIDAPHADETIEPPAGDEQGGQA
ncbi:MAG TPA: NADH-quinone oxidoreductase subunit J [bacterium]|nr:NADH-quinone oxidoreductase subunit J [bacterium]